MITTVTLNAALDKEYRLKTLQPGTVMRVAGCEVTAGGKGLNVARVASALGHPVCASGFLGGHTGAQIEENYAGPRYSLASFPWRAKAAPASM